MKRLNENEIKERGKFAVILKSLLMRKSIKQGQLAKAVGISSATVTHYINGKFTPSQKILEKIAEYLGVTPDTFFGDIEEYAPYITQYHFSSQLSNLIRINNMTCEQLAKEVGVSRQSISNYLNERQMPTATIAKKIADFFGVSVDFLLNPEALEAKSMKLMVTHLPESPEECLFYVNLADNPFVRIDEEIYYCKVRDTKCKMRNGVCPFLEKRR